MNYKEFKEMMENAPEDSELAHLREAMKLGAIDTINDMVKELMTEYSLTYGEAFIILKNEWDKFYAKVRTD